MDFDRDALLEVFTAEAEEHLLAMEQAVLTWEQHPDERELVDVVFRGAHTIKGNSASLGFGSVAELAHVFEDLLERLRSGATPLDPDVTSTVLEGVDALRAALAHALAGNSELQPEHLLLMERVRGRNTGGVPPVAATTQPAPAGSSFTSTEQPVGRRAAGGSAGIRVPLARLDELLNVAGQLAIGADRLGVLLTRVGNAAEAARELHEDLGPLRAQLQDLVLRARLVPVAPILRQQVRSARDVAAGLGKRVRVMLEGEHVEIDAALLEHLKDPLTHIVRNAVDHGIEHVAARRAAGKSPEGTLHVKATRDAGFVRLEVADDGAGMSRERIRAKAVAQGLIAPDARLTDAELLQCIFRPGFSTAEQVTRTSGRGVGMDVVREHIERVRGTVEVSSTEGKGTRIVLRLPSSLALVDALTLRCGPAVFLLPMSAVVECVSLPDRPATPRGILDFRGRPLPFAALDGLLHASGSQRVERSRSEMVVVRGVSGDLGLLVDEVLDSVAALVEPVAPIAQAPACISGSSLLADGQVGLFVDVGRLLLRAEAGTSPLPS